MLLGAANSEYKDHRPPSLLAIRHSPFAKKRTPETHVPGVLLRAAAPSCCGSRGYDVEMDFTRDLERAQQDRSNKRKGCERRKHIQPQGKVHVTCLPGWLL